MVKLFDGYKRLAIKIGKKKEWVITPLTPIFTALHTESTVKYRLNVSCEI